MKKRVFVFLLLLGASKNSLSDNPSLPEKEANNLIGSLGLTSSSDAALASTFLDRHVLVELPQELMKIVPSFKGRLLRAANGNIKLSFKSTLQVLKQTDALKNINGIIGFCNTKLVMKTGEELEWFHNYRAGMDACMGITEEKKQRIVFTNSKRLASPTIAEHAIAMLLSIARGIPGHHKNQMKKIWARDSINKVIFGEITGKTILVVGLGGIGTEIARRAHALDMNVTGIRRSSRAGPDFVNYVGLSNELLNLASKADVVVNALPLTIETEGLFNQTFFKSIRKGAIFISVGRGRSTVTKDLVAALRAGKIYGAGLDVTDPEPLPPDSPLWQMENVIITPHIAGISKESIDRLATIAAENLRRYTNGEPLLNVVDMRFGY